MSGQATDYLAANARPDLECSTESYGSNGSSSADEHCVSSAIRSADSAGAHLHKCSHADIYAHYGAGSVGRETATVAPFSVTSVWRRARARFTRTFGYDWSTCATCGRLTWSGLPTILPVHDPAITTGAVGSEPDSGTAVDTQEPEWSGIRSTSSGASSSSCYVYPDIDPSAPPSVDGATGENVQPRSASSEYRPYPLYTHIGTSVSMEVAEVRRSAVQPASYRGSGSADYADIPGSAQHDRRAVWPVVGQAGIPAASSAGEVAARPQPSLEEVRVNASRMV